MFDDLSKKLDGVLAKFRQRGLLTEPMVREGLREVRRVLLEADVNFQVTRDFLKRVQEKGGKATYIMLGADIGKNPTRTAEERIT